MNRKQIREVLESTNNRFRKIVLFSILSILLLICSVGLIVISVTKDDSKIIHYDDKSNLDYKVFYKKNDYFDSFVGKNQQYIASLIDHVEADFDYKMKIADDIRYSYYYYIDAEINVVDKSGKTLYQKTDNIIKKTKYNDFSEKSYEINQKVKLNYGYYNNIANTFISRYSLRDTTSFVNLKMYVGIVGNCDGRYGSIKDNSVISLKIPLTTDTVNIEMNYNLSQGKDKKLECIVESSSFNVLIILGVLFCIASILIAVYTWYYMEKTRSPLTKYNKRLKSIFNNYGRYISKIKTELTYDKFQIVFVEQFEDLFEARNSSQSPILFSQNADKTKSAFVVPTNSGLVYVYYLTIGSNKVVSNEEKVESKSEEII